MNIYLAIIILCALCICTITMWMVLSGMKEYTKQIFLKLNYLSGRILDISDHSNTDYLGEIKDHLEVIRTNSVCIYINNKEQLKVLNEINSDLSTILEDISSIENKAIENSYEDIKEIKQDLNYVRDSLKFKTVTKDELNNNIVEYIKDSAKQEVDKKIEQEKSNLINFKDKNKKDTLEQLNNIIEVYPWNKSVEWRKELPQRLRWDLVPEERKITPELIIAYRGEKYGKREVDLLENFKCEMAIDWGSRWGKRFGIYKRCAKPVSEGKTCCALHAKLPKFSDPEEDEKELIEELKKESEVKK